MYKDVKSKDLYWVDVNTDYNICDSPSGNYNKVKFGKT